MFPLYLRYKSGRFFDSGVHKRKSRTFAAECLRRQERTDGRENRENRKLVVSVLSIDLGDESLERRWTIILDSLCLDDSPRFISTRLELTVAWLIGNLPRYS